MVSSKVKSISLSQILNCFTISLVFVDKIISNYFTVINFKQMNWKQMMLSAVKNYFLNTAVVSTNLLKVITFNFPLIWYNLILKQ